MIKIGDKDVKKIYVGDKPVKKIMLGDKQIWPVEQLSYKVTYIGKANNYGFAPLILFNDLPLPSGWDSGWPKYQKANQEAINLGLQDGQERKIKIKYTLDLSRLISNGYIRELTMSLVNLETRNQDKTYNSGKEYDTSRIHATMESPDDWTISNKYGISFNYDTPAAVQHRDYNVIVTFNVEVILGNII